MINRPQRLNADPVESKRWAAQELEILMSRADEYTRRGKRIKWHKFAHETGHPDSSCAHKYYSIRRRAAELADRAAIDEAIAAAEAEQPAKRASEPFCIPSPAAKRGLDFGGGNTTAKLQMDAEMRARIEILGITAGLLGDPPPGRSVLDKRRLGIVDPPAPPNHREAYYASQAKITLATEPMR